MPNRAPAQRRMPQSQRPPVSAPQRQPLQRPDAAPETNVRRQPAQMPAPNRDMLRRQPPNRMPARNPDGTPRRNPSGVPRRYAAQSRAKAPAAPKESLFQRLKKNWFRPDLLFFSAVLVYFELVFKLSTMRSDFGTNLFLILLFSELFLLPQQKALLKTQGIRQELKLSFSFYLRNFSIEFAKIFIHLFEYSVAVFCFFF